MSTATAEPVISTAIPRCEFVLFFDVRNGNPNGDPDAGNAPRLDPETGHGLVSDVCIKRKIRNYFNLTMRNGDGPRPGYDVYVAERAVLNDQHKRAYAALSEAGQVDAKIIGKNGDVDESKIRPGDENKARDWMCRTFFDVRMFGAVMSTGVNAGQVRGPVQIAFSSSVDPIVSLEQSITRMAVTTEKEAAAQKGGNRTMGRKEIVPYGLYRCHGFINPFLAEQTGFSRADLDLLWSALLNMFEHDRSAARGEMATQKLFVFEHDNPLGGAPAAKLFRAIKAARKDESRPARSFDDYEITVDRGQIPSSVKLHEKL